MTDTDNDSKFNKFWAAVEVLNRGRDVLIDGLADEILSQADNLVDGGFLFNEFVEAQGTRVHFLCLLISQLEQAAETLDEKFARTAPPKKATKETPPAAPKKRRSRAKSAGTTETKKIARQSPHEDSADET